MREINSFDEALNCCRKFEESGLNATLTGSKMENDELIATIELSRRDVLALVNDRYDALLEAIRTGGSITGSNALSARLQDNAALFKGKKPVAVILPDGCEITVATWKEVVQAIFTDCFEKPTRYAKLLTLNGRIAGKSRVLVSRESAGMGAPVQIGDGLFFESKFDTETLLNVLMHRVLDAIGYDYSGIYIRYRQRKT